MSIDNLSKSQLCRIAKSKGNDLKSIDDNVLTQILEDELASIIGRKITDGDKVQYSSGVRKIIENIKYFAEPLNAGIILVYENKFTKTEIIEYHINALDTTPFDIIRQIADQIDTKLLFDSKIYIKGRVIFISNKAAEQLKLLEIIKSY